ncbi:MAG: DUF2752 domain-containing protein, partial [Planctomycetes bacterium]|nr:DUF2752 domain-containing protein [Planctomycetota bacterium]
MPESPRWTLRWFFARSTVGSTASEDYRSNDRSSKKQTAKTIYIDWLTQGGCSNRLVISSTSPTLRRASSILPRQIVEPKGQPMSQHDLESTEQHSHPLGPLIYRTPVQQNAGFRAKAIMVLLAAGAIIGTAGFVTPDPKGFGTHEQLGQQRCSWPRQYAIPCPTCGMTTAFAYVVRGRMLSG